MGDWNSKRVFITGVCGTVGREVLSQVLKLNPREIVGIDNNESELFFLDDIYKNNNKVNLYLGDIRDETQLVERTRGIDIILHAAAYKHVILCEHSPRSAVQTNILGTQNIIDAANANSVERVILTSSDKAVNPTNVMGTSKLMGERLLTAANALRHGDRPIFASTRFGNVLGSRGSVIPLFMRQIASGGPVTLTDENMTRFIMSLEEAVSLVTNSVFLAKGGEVFVTKMHVVRIVDLAEVMIEELASRYGYKACEIKIEKVGPRPGEKMYEELINDEEVRRTVEMDRYFVVVPALKSLYCQCEYDYEGIIRRNIESPYNSSNQKPMDKSLIRDYLYANKLIEL